MAEGYDFLSVSSGSGDAALMRVTAIRTAGAATISVDTVAAFQLNLLGHMAHSSRVVLSTQLPRETSEVASQAPHSLSTYLSQAQSTTAIP